MKEEIEEVGFELLTKGDLMPAISKLARIIVSVLLIALTQACASQHYSQSCAVFIKHSDYFDAADHKAIAQYFDRESGKPQGHQKGVVSECWFMTEAESQEYASQRAVEACDESLQEIDRFTDWNCLLVAEGNEITFAEKARLAQSNELASNARRRGDSRVLRTKSNNKGVLSNSSRKPTKSPKGGKSGQTKPKG
jgi:hypothetical protein